jgi:DUSP domain
MQSDTSSSSPKRSASECPSHDSGARSPTPDQISVLPPSDRDQDIDTYMATQENVEHAAGPTMNGNLTHVDSLRDKLILIQNLMKESMEVGDTWYLISRPWFRRWQMVCTGGLDKEEDLGPVDNSLLLDGDGNLNRDIQEGIDVEYVPTEAWSHFTMWLVYIPAYSPWSSLKFPVLGTVPLGIHFLAESLLVVMLSCQPSSFIFRDSGPWSFLTILSLPPLRVPCILM